MRATMNSRPGCATPQPPGPAPNASAFGRCGTCRTSSTANGCSSYLAAMDLMTFRSVRPSTYPTDRRPVRAVQRKELVEVGHRLGLGLVECIVDDVDRDRAVRREQC